MDEDPSDVEVETYGESGIEAHLPHEHLALDMDPGEGPMPVDLESEGDEGEYLSITSPLSPYTNKTQRTMKMTMTKSSCTKNRKVS